MQMAVRNQGFDHVTYLTWYKCIFFRLLKTLVERQKENVLVDSICDILLLCVSQPSSCLLPFLVAIVTLYTYVLITIAVY